MWDNLNIPLPVPGRFRSSPEGYPLTYGYEKEGTPPPKKENTLQRLLTESAAEELARQLENPFHPIKTDLAEILSSSAALLSTMAAELGVILRIQIRAERVQASADEEKIRRVINALIIHLLTVSQSEGRVTVGMDDQSVNGRRGCLLQLNAGSVVLPWKTNPEYEEELNSQAELSLCRKIVEKQGGNLAVSFQENNALVYSIWLPT
jgi:light-regulated signal transduction histidine kinase (bacteriophytochrome)